MRAGATSAVLVVVGVALIGLGLSLGGDLLAQGGPFKLGILSLVLAAGVMRGRARSRG